jgi:ATP-dependent Clp protease ATP-binding subunit ClpB
VQTAIGDRLAKGILSGQIVDGDTVVVDVLPGADTLTVEPQNRTA